LSNEKFGQKILQIKVFSTVKMIRNQCEGHLEAFLNRDRYNKKPDVKRRHPDSVARLKWFFLSKQEFFKTCLFCPTE